jgi:hypothetical protein
MIWEGFTGMAFIGDLHFGKVISTLSNPIGGHCVLIIGYGREMING